MISEEFDLDEFKVSASPHIRSKNSTSRIMFIVILALLPVTGFGIYNFGIRAAISVAVCVATCVLSELIYELIMRQPVTIGDFSAVVTGMMLALILPTHLPWWIMVVGGVFAIIIVKMLFGGVGQNIMNPALAARCFLLICFTSRMRTFRYDGITTATPLDVLKNGGTVNAWDMFIGFTPGTIGDTSVIAIAIGAMILILTGVIDLRIPASYLISFVIFLMIFADQGRDPYYITCQLCGGGLMFAAFFMATDYATSPITNSGKIIYGILLGCMTGLFRVYSSLSEGIGYAIIFCNLLVPLIESITLPKCFGKGGEF